MTEAEITKCIAGLAQDSDTDRVLTLQYLARNPTGDPRVREALEKLLDDATPCLLQIPYRFGEMRLLAAAALAAERSAVGDQRPVHVRTIAPLTADRLGVLQHSANLAVPVYPGDVIAKQLHIFALLRERQLLPELDLDLRHPVFIGWLDPES